MKGLFGALPWGALMNLTTGQFVGSSIHVSGTLIFFGGGVKLKVFKCGFAGQVFSCCKFLYNLPGWNCWIIEYSSLKWQSKQSLNFKIGAPSVLSRKLFCISIIIRIDYSIQQRLFTYLHTYQLFNVQNPHGQVRHLPAFCINLFGFIVLLHSVLLLVPSFLGFSDFISAWITSRSLLRGQSLGFLSSVQCMIDFLGHASSSICIKCP